MHPPVLLKIKTVQQTKVAGNFSDWPVVYGRLKSTSPHSSTDYLDIDILCATLLILTLRQAKSQVAAQVAQTMTITIRLGRHLLESAQCLRSTPEQRRYGHVFTFAWLNLECYPM